jgi:hypothetical protein
MAPPDVAPYALWLLPPPPVAAEAQGWIDAQAVEFGGPAFLPHITLWGRVDLAAGEARRRAAELAGEMCPLALGAAGLGFRDLYYQALFVPLAVTGPLWRAYQRAAQIFAGVAEPPPFLPHLSLAYTEATAAERLRGAARRVTAGSLPDVSFTVTELALIHAAGGPGDWREVTRYSL